MVDTPTGSAIENAAPRLVITATGSAIENAEAGIVVGQTEQVNLYSRCDGKICYNSSTFNFNFSSTCDHNHFIKFQKSNMTKI
jgi:hypothetical protein